MSQYEVEADEPLFERWKSLGSRIACQKSIVQNDMVINTEELTEWQQHTLALLDDFKMLILDTKRHVTQKVVE